MKEWQAVFQAFGRMKNGLYLHFGLTESGLGLAPHLERREGDRWRRVREDLKERGMKLVGTRSRIRLEKVEETDGGFRFVYLLRASWRFRQGKRTIRQDWQEEGVCRIVRDGGWVVAEDRPLVEEGALPQELAGYGGSAALRRHGWASQREGSFQLKPEGLPYPPSPVAGLLLRLPQERRGYDRTKAVEYAHRYWNSYNPQFIHFDVDCTNYVSQCLWAGGAPMTYRPSRSEGWWYRFLSPPQWSFSWSVAHALRWYLGTSKGGLKGEEVEKASLLEPGDVICYDFEGDGRFNHTTIVVAKDENGEPLVNAHTTNSRNRYWAYRDSTAWTPKIRYKFFRIVV